MEAHIDAAPPPTRDVGDALDPGQPYADLFAALWPRLYRTALGISGDPGVAEDAVQCAFAKAYASWRRVSRADHPEAYLRRMVVNEVLGTQRRGWWRRERPSAQVEATTSLPSPEDGVVLRDAVWTAVQALPLRQRAVVVLRYYGDLSEEQIAEALGCSRGTVKSQASAALATLRASGIETDGAEQ